MPIFLGGISLAFFRAIGPEVQNLGPFKDFNFFVGANNAGKSTVLDAIHRYFGTTGQEPSFEPLDSYTGQQTGRIKFQIGVLKETFEAPILERLEVVSRGRFPQSQVARLQEAARKVCDWLADERDLIWLRDRTEIPPSTIRGAVPDQDWYQLWSTLMVGMSGGGRDSHWIPATLTNFFELQKGRAVARSQFIPTNRQIGRASEDFSDFSGRGLIDRLAELQSPDYNKRHEYELFSKINEFIQTVTGRHNARIEIPHNRDHVLVHMDNKVLPLSNLGTGIHEVVMIAAFCTISENQMVCIEEPESHLHPLLQRKLISYLKAKTSNQYFIATHSAAFIDTPGAAIFHVTNDGVQTKIKETILRRERFSICNDLGVRASDIVQSNFVVWVEGPSDRLYLRRWIERVNPELKEGIDYTIMFYGGRLLSHLSADDEAVTEFIDLRSLNQNLCVLMDSDRSSAHDQINDTKTRIFKEVSKGGGKAWITKGREVENYIQFDKLQEAIRTVHPKIYHSAGPRGDYKHTLYFYPKTDGGGRSSKPYTDADKVKIARELTKDALDMDILDLKSQVADLVDRIKKANA